jgi:hypothetical protein
MTEQLYRSNLNPDLKPVSKKILKKHFPGNVSWDAVKMTAALHLYVSDQIGYDSRDNWSGSGRRPFRSPVKAWKNDGNCEEQSVLLASLLGSVRGVESKLVSVTRPDTGQRHLLVMSGFRLGADRVSEKLDSFYSSIDGFISGSQYSWKTGAGVYWFICDAEFANHVGDRSSLTSSNYVTSTRDGWSWCDKNYEITV